MSPNLSWEFTDNNALIGLKGQMRYGTLRQLSFLTYSTSPDMCPKEEEDRPDPGPEPGPEPETEQQPKE